ncbi:hypothetical protein BR10RB9215_C10240 [Brucella sp. 10RB9215]|nr:hypothetical protein BR10RB9215_C10240 [Brucella sp. 10RB9215]
MTVRTIDEIFRDFVIDGVPASGPFNPHKPDIRDTLKVLLEGVSTFPDNRVIRLNNADEGTANNIVVTSSVAIPTAAYQVLYILNVTQVNTGPVTVSGAINRSLVTNINQPIAPGYLIPGMAVLCVDTGTELRLLSYGDAEAEQAAAEAAADRAEDAAAAAEAAAGGLLSNFASRLEVEAANIPALVSFLRTAGYYSAGDGGGALYKRSASEPTHAGKVQSVDGAWWEISGVTINVLQFGAKGDNTQDDSLNFQAAVDYVKSKGRGEIVVPGYGRVYNFQSKRPAGLTPWAFEDPNVFFSECNDLTIRGEGNPTLTNSIYPNNRAEIFLFYKSNRCRIERIKFLGNNVGLPNEINNCAIGMLSCVGIDIDRNHFTGFQGSYIASSWLFDSLISRNRFDVLGGSGIDCAFWQNVTVRDNAFNGNQMGNNGLGTQGFQHMFDTPNFGNNETGISLIGGSSNNIKLTNNTVENFRTGVIMGDAYDWSLHGNTVRLNGSDGMLVMNNDTSVSLFAMTGGAFVDNKITRNGSAVNSAGVRIVKGTASLVEISFSNNTIQDNKNNGINPDAPVILKMSNNRMSNKYTNDQTVDVANILSLGAGSLLTGNYPINPSPPFGAPLPSGTNVAVYNTRPWPITITQLGGVGIVLVSPAGVETAMFPNNVTTFRVPPYYGVKFTTTNTSGWLWTSD